MFRQVPDQRLWLVKQRRAELIHEAEQYRLTRARTVEPADHAATPLFTSISASLGRPFASLRRAISVSEAPCDDLCPDCAPC